jgi:hypothetical protein
MGSMEPRPLPAVLVSRFARDSATTCRVTLQPAIYLATLDRFDLEKEDEGDTKSNVGMTILHK